MADDDEHELDERDIFARPKGGSPDGPSDFLGREHRLVSTRANALLTNRAGQPDTDRHRAPSGTDVSPANPVLPGMG